MAVLTEEQSMLRDAARTWTQEKSPVSAFRKMRDSGAPLGYDPAAFAEMARDGLDRRDHPRGIRRLGLRLPEPGPDAGRDRPHAHRLAAAVARALAAASALILGGTDAQKEAWLPKIAAGEAGRHPGHRRRPAPRAGKGRAGRHQDRRRLQRSPASKTFVLEGMAAGLFVVSARTSGKAGDKDGITLFLVPADAKGVSRKALKLADSRGAANVTFDKRRSRRRRRAGRSRQGLRRCWKRSSTAPAPASRPRCWARPSRPSRPPSTT